jgi:hypothetical protein
MPFSEIAKFDLKETMPKFSKAPFGYGFDIEKQTQLEETLLDDALLIIFALARDLAIIPDPQLDPEQWVLSNKPFLHVRVGMHIWEELRACRGPITKCRLWRYF